MGRRMNRAENVKVTMLRLKRVTLGAGKNTVAVSSSPRTGCGDERLCVACVCVCYYTMIPPISCGFDGIGGAACVAGDGDRHGMGWLPVWLEMAIGMGLGGRPCGRRWRSGSQKMVPSGNPKMGFQTGFWYQFFTIGVAIGPFGLKLERFYITSRPACDPTTPEVPNTHIWLKPGFGIWGFFLYFF